MLAIQSKKQIIKEKISEMEKYFTLSDYNKYRSNTLDPKIAQKKLIDEYDLDRKIKEEIKTLAIKPKLKADKDKIVKLQTYDLSLFIDQSVNYKMT